MFALRVVARSAYTRTSVTLRPSVLTVRHYASGSHILDGDAELIDVEKRRNLSGKQHLTSTTHEEQAPGWNEYLASSSEAHIKADRHGEDGPPTIELTQRTIKHLKNRHNGLRNSREEATYERDEVLGPLKSSSAGTTECLDVENKQEVK